MAGSRGEFYLNKDSDESDQSTWRAKELGPGHDAALRVVAEKVIRLLDNALLKSFGWGLAAFLPESQVRALLPNETRYFVDMVPPGEQEQRRHGRF